MYEQGIGTMALSEAYALTRDPALKKPAQRAIDYTLSQMGADINAVVEFEELAERGEDAPTATLAALLD